MQKQMLLHVSFFEDFTAFHYG